jgi:hypothetical protein
MPTVRLAPVSAAARGAASSAGSALAPLGAGAAAAGAFVCASASVLLSTAASAVAVPLWLFVVAGAAVGLCAVPGAGAAGLTPCAAGMLASAPGILRRSRRGECGSAA